MNNKDSYFRDNIPTCDNKKESVRRLLEHYSIKQRSQTITLKHIGRTDIEISIVYFRASTLRDVNQTPIVAEIDAIMVEHRHTCTQAKAEIKSLQAVRSKDVGLCGALAVGCLGIAKQTHTEIGTKRTENAYVALAEEVVITDMYRYLEVIGARYALYATLLEGGFISAPLELISTSPVKKNPS